MKGQGKRCAVALVIIAVIAGATHIADELFLYPEYYHAVIFGDGDGYSDENYYYDDEDEEEAEVCEISWSEAADYIGEECCVYGYVASVGGRNPYFINLGNAYPDTNRFQVVIYGEVMSRFNYDPLSEYAGRNVIVWGTVTEYNGIPQIILSSPDDIEEAV